MSRIIHATVWKGTVLRFTMKGGKAIEAKVVG